MAVPRRQDRVVGDTEGAADLGRSVHGVQHIVLATENLMAEISSRAALAPWTYTPHRTPGRRDVRPCRSPSERGPMTMLD